MSLPTPIIQLLSEHKDWKESLTSALEEKAQLTGSISSCFHAKDLLTEEQFIPAVLVANMSGNTNENSALLGNYIQNPKLADTVFIMISPEEQIEDLQQYTDGRVAYHFTRSVQIANLVAIIHSATTDYVSRTSLKEEVRKRKSAIGNIIAGEFEIRTLEEARNLSTMLSFAYPNPEEISIGILELMINGIEHGNLEIGFDEKSELIASNQWKNEIDRRLKTKRYADKKLNVKFQKLEDKITLKVTDQGEGFDFEQYLNGACVHVGASHGRGIFLSRELYFNDLYFVEKGNIVNAIYLLPPALGAELSETDRDTQNINCRDMRQ